jgi:hypothetical protein
LSRTAPWQRLRREATNRAINYQLKHKFMRS